MKNEKAKIESALLREGFTDYLIEVYPNLNFRVYLGSEGEALKAAQTLSGVVSFLKVGIRESFKGFSIEGKA